MPKKLAAIRGATRVQNTADDIRAQTAALYDALLAQNSLAESDLLSLEFSVTGDVDALNPAQALRESGRARSLAMMVYQEGRFAGSLPLTVRALLYANIGETREPRFVYRNGAEALRPDLA